MPDKDDILNDAFEPAQASGDQGSVTQVSISDKIKALRFSKTADAMATDKVGLRFRQMKPPGAS